LDERAIATWGASGVGWTAANRHEADLPALLETFRTLGVPDELVTATGIAAAKTREPITLMVPLIWLDAHCGDDPTVIKADVPVSRSVDDVPMYALDKHTRLGRDAIRRFAVTNEVVRANLERYVPAVRRRDAAYMAAFYADAAPIATKLVWKGADELEAFGRETDLLKSGVRPEGFAPLLAAFRDNLGHLDEIRAECFVRQRSTATGPQIGWPAGRLG
jgi:hypothetical protein